MRVCVCVCVCVVCVWCVCCVNALSITTEKKIAIDILTRVCHTCFGTTYSIIQGDRHKYARICAHAYTCKRDE